MESKLVFYLKICGLLFASLFFNACDKEINDANGKLIVRYSMFSDIVTVSQYNTSGTLLRKMELLGALPHGSYSEYYSNGNPSVQATKNMGKLDGIIYNYTESGKLFLKETYKSDVLDGWRYTYDTLSGQVDVVAFYASGFKHYTQKVDLKGKPSGSPEFYIKPIYDKPNYRINDTIRCTLVFPFKKLSNYSEGFTFIWGQIEPDTKLTTQIANDYALMEKPVDKDSILVEFEVMGESILLDYFAMTYRENGKVFVCPVDESTVFQTQNSLE